MQKLKGKKLGSSPDVTQLANRCKTEPGGLALAPLLSTPLLTGWKLFCKDKEWNLQFAPGRSRGETLEINVDKWYKEAIKMGWDGLMRANPQWWRLKGPLRAQRLNAHFKVICVFVMETLAFSLLPFSHQISSEVFYADNCVVWLRQKGRS